MYRYIIISLYLPYLQSYSKFLANFVCFMCNYEWNIILSYKIMRWSIDCVGCIHQDFRIKSILKLHKCIWDWYFLNNNTEVCIHKCILERTFLLISCLYSCWYTLLKFLFILFPLKWFYAEIAFDIKYTVLSYPIDIVLTLCYIYYIYIYNIQAYV